MSKRGMVNVKELGMLKTWKPRWATFNNGMFQLFDSTTSTKPIITLFLPSSTVFIGENEERKSNSIHHFHIIYAGGRFCVSAENPDDVDSWFSLLKTWGEKIPYKPFPNRKHTSDSSESEIFQPKSESETTYATTIVVSISGLGSCECEVCYSSLKNSLIGSRELGVQKVFFLKDTNDREPLTVKYPTLSFSELTEIQLCSVRPEIDKLLPFEVWLKRKEDSLIAFIEELGYFCTIVI